MDEFEEIKCRCCRCYDSYDGCQAWYCEHDFRLVPSKIKEEAKRQEMTVSDIIELLRLGGVHV